VRERLKHEIEALRGEIAALMQAAVQAGSEALAEKHRAGGRQRRAQPADVQDFGNDMGSLRKLFDVFEQKTELMRLLDVSSRAEGVRIYIGGESHVVPFEELSVVTAPYEVDGRIVGTLGVIGPTRMAYDRMIQIVDITSRLVSNALSPSSAAQELWDVALTLEPLSARLAAQQRTEDDLALLEANLAASASEKRWDRLVALDMEFHALIGRASHNRALMLAREPVGLLYDPTLQEIFKRLPQANARNLDAHAGTLDAVRRGDAELAAEWTRKHMVDFQRGFAMAGLDMSKPIAQPS
jgi:hypothetical protein